MFFNSAKSLYPTVLFQAGKYRYNEMELDRVGNCVKFNFLEMDLHVEEMDVNKGFTSTFSQYHSTNQFVTSGFSPSDAASFIKIK